MAKVLVIGASGRIGSKIVKEFDKNSEGVEVVLGTHIEEEAEKWRDEGRDAVVFDLNNPAEFPDVLDGVERVFLLTTYTSDMLFQAKMMVDAAKEAGVKHIVHLGVFTSRRDPLPHFVWHDLIESYIATSGIFWTNVHPNVITESILVTNPPITETSSFTSMCDDAPQGWACTDDIAAVAATVLREGPSKHAGKDYYISTEVLKSSEVAKILSEVAGKEIKVNYVDKEQQVANFNQITSAPVRSYMDSAIITMELTKNEKFAAQRVVRDDVMTVVGRPGTTMKDWANKYLNFAN
ncbi:NmrA family NAD(P)-binding protein [Paenibacillus illinoisensis]|uniref:NmrA family protein n=1 Tax=Paenibacillus illinoisensis TaxID=59845 RepID=A0A2W0CB95_9BACL|nr:NmrA family NAD(P)-binding protein [Paenibacillus illinoisensis]PYY27899.1 NmrA family protein [Paenibacillus illinoisensis]